LSKEFRPTVIPEQNPPAHARTLVLKMFYILRVNCSTKMQAHGVLRMSVLLMSEMRIFIDFLTYLGFIFMYVFWDFNLSLDVFFRDFLLDL